MVLQDYDLDFLTATFDSIDTVGLGVNKVNCLLTKTNYYLIKQKSENKVNSSSTSFDSSILYTLSKSKSAQSDLLVLHSKILEHYSLLFTTQ